MEKNNKSLSTLEYDTLGFNSRLENLYLAHSGTNEKYIENSKNELIALEKDINNNIHQIISEMEETAQTLEINEADVNPVYGKDKGLFMLEAGVNLKNKGYTLRLIEKKNNNNVYHFINAWEEKMFNLTNYNKQDLGYSMPSKVSLQFYLGFVLLLPYNTYLLVESFIAGKFSLLLLLSLVCLVFVCIFLYFAGSLYYEKERAVFSKIFVLIAFAFLVLGLFLRMNSVNPPEVESDVLLISGKFVLFDILNTFGFVFLYSSGRIYLWSTFKKTCELYSSLTQHQSVLEKYRILLNRLNQKRAYFSNETKQGLKNTGNINNTNKSNSNKKQ